MTRQMHKILAIDDTPTNLLTLGTALAAEFDLQIATSGMQGIALAQSNPPDLILLDVMMPEMDGYETCRRLKAIPQLSTTPIVFVTALAEVEAETAGLALGAADYITKPINVEIARHRIRNLIEREQMRKEIEHHRQHLEALVAERTAALSIAKEAAEAANRAKSTFLMNMSHELHTPMNAIMGLTYIALSRAEEPKLRDQLGKIDQAAHQLLTILDDILDMSLIESERLTLDENRFRLDQLLTGVYRLTEHLAQDKGLELSCDIPAEIAALELIGDAMRLRQVLLNLCNNAVKFTEDGSIALRLRLESETSAQVLLRFEIADTGIGIAPENRDRLFDRFEQADGSMTRKHSGTGLGLAISKRLVQMMGGRIGVDSQPGQGSTFWLTIRFDKYPG